MRKVIRKVLIGTPCFDGRVDAWYAHSLVETIKLCAARDVVVFPIFQSYDSLLQRARNDLVQTAVEDQFDDLFFIDSDQGWEPEWFFELLGHEVDVVGAPVRLKADDIEAYNVKSSVFPIPVDPRTGLWIVESVGTGFLRMSRNAFTDLWTKSEEYRIDSGKVARWVFDLRPVDGRLVGEDVALCKRLREEGFNVFLDPRMNPSHVGIKKWTGDFGDWIMRVAKEKGEKEAARLAHLPTMDAPHLRKVRG